MRPLALIAASTMLLCAGEAVAQDRIDISSKWGSVTAELNNSESARALKRMLPLTIELRDHLRQEKTGTLSGGLPEGRRQQAFSAGTLGLWGTDHFVIYYRSGRVPQPGIIVLGAVTGDVSIFDRPGPVSIQIRDAK
jgi:hypothetical protein